MAKRARRRSLFQSAVEGTAEVKDSYRTGLRGLKEVDRNRMDCSEPRTLTGSLNLEAALRESRPNDPIWDYAIGTRVSASKERLHWVEVHPASPKNVADVLRKRDWLRRWLIEAAPRLSALPAAYVWIASGRVSIPKNSPQMKRLAAKGIRFVGRRLAL